MPDNDDTRRTCETTAIDLEVAVGNAEPQRDTTPPPVVPRGRLVQLVGEELGNVHHLRGGPTVIGRAADCEIRIAGADDVSRHHARITWEGDHYVIEDLGSRNGIAVNGMPVHRHPLAIGDRIQIAASALLVFTVHDELENRALRLQKLDALGQLASSVVHDFRNLLGVIEANVHLLAEYHAELRVQHADAAQSLADIAEASARGTRLVQRLLYFARRNDPGGWAQVHLGALVSEVAGLVDRTLQREHAIAVEVDVAALGAVRGNAEELHHVILNLCLNARDAMPHGGRLVVSGRCHSLDRAEALRQDVRRAGQYFEISVADTGIGMDEATMARVFEPFFTTKPAGQGTGLGLSSAFGVVRNHGGNIFVESKVGHGSTFRILLPASAP